MCWEKLWVKVAIKIVDKIHAPSVVREIETWRHLHHANIAQLYEVLTTETRIYMVTELCSGGEAFEYICENGKMDDRSPETRRIFKEIVEAVGYCHDKNVVHRNILLTDDLTVKLIDFGFTREYTDPGSPGYLLWISRICSSRDDNGKEVLGSAGGHLVLRRYPFYPYMWCIKKITELDFEIPDFLSPVTKDLIRKILLLDATERISISGILSHSWFQNDDDASTPSSSVPAKTPLGSTPEEATLVSHMEALSVLILRASAFWYLLLSKQRAPPSTGTSAAEQARMDGRHQTLSASCCQDQLQLGLRILVFTAAISSGSGVPNLLLPTGAATRSPNISMEQYLENAKRRKSMPAEIGGMSAVAMTEMGMGMTGGRRGVMMEAMRAGSVARVKSGARYGRRAMWANGASGGVGLPGGIGGIGGGEGAALPSRSSISGQGGSRGGSGASSPCGSDSGSLNGLGAGSGVATAPGVSAGSAGSASVGDLEESEGEEGGADSFGRRYAPLSGAPAPSRLRTGSLKPTSTVSSGMASPAEGQSRSPILGPAASGPGASIIGTRPRAPGSAGSMRKEPPSVDAKSRPKSAMTGLGGGLPLSPVDD
ncbi:kinase-like domain-containing protein [Chytridium lagenaria]|nr:kinase-like domain-containing protein [Chytridium lagenaria]